MVRTQIEAARRHRRARARRAARRAARTFRAGREHALRPTRTAPCRSDSDQTISQPYMVAVDDGRRSALTPDRPGARGRHRIRIPGGRARAARARGDGRSSAMASLPMHARARLDCARAARTSTSWSVTAPRPTRTGALRRDSRHRRGAAVPEPLRDQLGMAGGSSFRWAPASHQDLDGLSSDEASEFVRSCRRSRASSCRSWAATAGAG